MLWCIMLNTNSHKWEGRRIKPSFRHMKLYFKYDSFVIIYQTYSAFLLFNLSGWSFLFNYYNYLGTVHMPKLCILSSNSPIIASAIIIEILPHLYIL